jgi:uncharacterized repeat protein (TIGR01451 family)
VPPGGRAEIQIRKGVAGTLAFDLWYSDLDRFDTAIQTPDTTYGPFVAPGNAGVDYRADLAEVTYYHAGGAAAKSSGSTNGKRELYLTLNGPVGTYTIALTGTTVSDGRFDATLNPSYEYDSTGANVMLNFIAPGSISDFGSSRNAISDACYVVRTSWIDIDGITRTQVGEGDPGDLWLGTSVGPTFDGRLGIDFSAPANNIITAYAPNSYWGTFRSNLINDGNGLYGRAGANSSSNPVVAGVIALMLEMNPSLTAIQIREILRQTARSDGFTGPVPNPKWGYGKVDALAALTAVSSLKPTLVTTVKHGGNFTQGQASASYTISILNMGTGASTGTVTVADTLPVGLTATAINGHGWECSVTAMSCSRFDALPPGVSFPPIGVTVSVDSNAVSPVTNQVNISGGGSPTTLVSDPTTIIPAFIDVDASDLFLPAIDLLRESGITTGCQASPPKYCSADNIPESQMAVFVIRSVFGNDNFSYTTSPYFTDVPAGNLYFSGSERELVKGID